jgi:hypothetical protein
MAKIKWYVNLPGNVKEHRGDAVPIRAKLSGSGDELPWIAKWSVEPDGGDNVESKYLSADARARTLDKFSLSGDDDAFTTWLKLPHVGGDRYKVKCSKPDDSASKESDVYETWRKIFVSVHYMDASALTAFNDLKGKVTSVFEKVFVELSWKPTAPKKTLVEEPWSCATPTHLPHLYDVTKDPLTHRPYHLRLVLVTELFDKVSESYPMREVRRAQCTAAGIRTYRFGRPIGWTKADSGCSRAMVSRGGADLWRDITGLAKKNGEDQLDINLKGDALAWAALTAGNPVWLDIRTNERDHGFNGYCLHNFATMKTNRPEGAAGIAQTFVHEVGHALRQATLWERKYDADGQADGFEKNPNWHEDAQGGQGPHCHYQAKLIASTRTTSLKIWAWNNQPLCVMFFCSDSHRTGEYCAKCTPLLKRTDLGGKALSGRALKNWPPRGPMIWTKYL